MRLCQSVTSIYQRRRKIGRQIQTSLLLDLNTPSGKLLWRKRHSNVSYESSSHIPRFSWLIHLPKLTPVPAIHCGCVRCDEVATIDREYQGITNNLAEREENVCNVIDERKSGNVYMKMSKNFLQGKRLRKQTGRTRHLYDFFKLIYVP
jgi:hypothetical protein